ncbi:hypothetical protein C5167_022560 [Papaver somniferum]|uniref:Uncharacterized protein n=1 Tax=Papaver somniferum TaxID=3469 RepID=A0A4Y7JLE5_PAPSO|nr:hypothetical protein C5167_022560 [Papaver somniferum]
MLSTFGRQNPAIRSKMMSHWIIILESSVEDEDDQVNHLDFIMQSSLSHFKNKDLIIRQKK